MGALNVYTYLILPIYMNSVCILYDWMGLVNGHSQCAEGRMVWVTAEMKDLIATEMLWLDDRVLHLLVHSFPGEFSR